MIIKGGYLVTEKGETVEATWVIDEGKVASVRDDEDVEYFRVDPEIIIMLGEYFKAKEIEFQKKLIELQKRR